LAHNNEGRDVSFPKPPFVLLDDSRTPNRADAGLLFSQPARILVARTLQEVPPLLEAIERLQGQGNYLAGWLAYEAGLVFHPTLMRGEMRLSREPLAWFGVFGPPRVLSSGTLDALFAAVPPHARALSLAPCEKEAAFARSFLAIQDHIAAGNVYQINHTFRLAGPFRGSVLRLYGDLRRAQPVCYGALINTGEWRVLSLSPELFVKREGTRIESRPMKGTAPAGRTWLELEKNRAALAGDEKNRAENLMITDLIRNDLARVARPGSVKVRRPFRVEKFGRVLQMTSEVHGTLKAGIRFRDIWRALFPCGSITGAPKTRAMEIISRTEASPRGVYTGALGFLAPGGDFTFNIPIRTLVLGADGQAHFGTGSGIVADSSERGEYEECLFKTRFLSDRPRPFALIETLLWREGGGFELLELHLERLSESARYFNFAFDERAARDALTALARTAKRIGALRVRLTCERDGNLCVEQKPYRAPQAPVGVAFSSFSPTPDDPFLFHKTTRREAYEQSLKKLARRRRLYDCLFLNEQQQVTEGSFNNVFVAIGRGPLATPPLGCGLLPGVLRRHLLESGQAEERVLHRKDIEHAEAFYLGNAVTGLIPAQVV
jgi:para-aminobenzoate synthetase / 4-amino-4-deoxychorismate lyase